MKTLKFLLTTVVVLFFVVSCSEDELLTNNLAEMSYQKAPGNQQNIFWVSPTGIDDTQNLKDAFANAQMAGPGSVVQLKAGNYYIDLIEIRDFNGTFKGAGKGKTIITTVENLNFDDVISHNLYPCLLKFLGGDVHVKGMSFLTKAESTDWFEGLVGFFGWSEVYVPTGKYIKVVADEIEIIGQKSNVGYGLMTGSDSKGRPGGVPWSKIDISVTNSHFANCAWYGACIMMIEEGNVEVGSMANSGNTFVSNKEWSYGNLGIWHFVNTKISITRNHFVGHLGRCGGLDVFSAPYPSFFAHSDQVFPSVANIEHNTFEVSNFLSAIIINDNRRFNYPEDEPMKVQLKNNHIHTTNNTSAIRCLNLVGSVFRNNKFTGTANNGVYLDGQNGVTTENGLIIGNNFSQPTYKHTIILQPVTRNWTIVGGNLGESILDYGTDNIITGFNNNTLEVPLGQIISDLLTETNMSVHDLKQ